MEKWLRKKVDGNILQLFSKDLAKGGGGVLSGIRRLKEWVKEYKGLLGHSLGRLGEERK